MALVRIDWENLGQGLFVDDSTGNLVLVGPDGSTQIFNSDDSTLTFANHALALTGGALTVTGTVAPANAAAAALLNEAATATNPSSVPNKADPDTGVAWAAADAMTLVAGGVEGLRLTEAASAVTLLATGTVNLANAAGPSLQNEAATGTNPTLIPNRAEVDTGIGWQSDELDFVCGGSQIAKVTTAGVLAQDAAGPALLEEAATVTNPTLVPNQADPDSGLGWSSADKWGLVAGGEAMLQMESTADASKFNGYGYHCISETFAYDDMTDGGATTGTYDLTIGIPDGAYFQKAICTALTGFTGDTSATIQVGDGTDVDRYQAATTPDVFVTNASGVDLGVASGTLWHDDAATVKVTITSGADFTSVAAGSLTLSLFYFGPAPA